MPRVSALVVGLVSALPELRTGAAGASTELQFRARAGSLHAGLGAHARRRRSTSRSRNSDRRSSSIRSTRWPTTASGGHTWRCIGTRRHSRAHVPARRLFSADASKVFNSQLDANRQRQDRLMELQDIRIAGVEGPAEPGHAGQHAPDRQCDPDDDATRSIAVRTSRWRIRCRRSSRCRSAAPTSAPSSSRKPSGSTGPRSTADPKAGEAHNNLAVILMMKAQYTDAMAELKAAEKAGFRVNPELKDQIKSRMAQ